MKRSKFSDAQVAMILRQADDGAALSAQTPCVPDGLRSRCRMGKSGSPFRWFECLAGVIGTFVMMSVRLPRSLRPVGDRLAGRGIDICHETVRLWWNRSGPMFADEIRRNCGRAMPGFTQWPWLVGEVFAPVEGKRHDLWRA